MWVRLFDRCVNAGGWLWVGGLAVAVAVAVDVAVDVAECVREERWGAGVETHFQKN